MNFKQAIEEMKKGKKVRRKGWGDVWFTLDNGGALLRNVPGPYNKKATITGLEPLTLESVENVYANDWEVVEEKEEKIWWEPKLDEKYFYIMGVGCIDYNNYDNDDADEQYQSIGNCFQTEEQAQFVVEKLKVIHELKIFAVENNEEEIDWNNDKQKKFFLHYNCITNRVSVDWNTYIKDISFNVYFTSESIAKKSIDAIGIERLKKYYFEVEEE